MITNCCRRGKGYSYTQTEGGREHVQVQRGPLQVQGKPFSDIATRHTLVRRYSFSSYNSNHEPSVRMHTGIGACQGCCQKVQIINQVCIYPFCHLCVPYRNCHQISMHIFCSFPPNSPEERARRASQASQNSLTINPDGTVERRNSIQGPASTTQGKVSKDSSVICASFNLSQHMFADRVKLFVRPHSQCHMLFLLQSPLA